MASQKPDGMSLGDDMSNLTIASPETPPEDFQPSVTNEGASGSEQAATDAPSAIDTTTTDPQEAKRLKAKEKKKRHEKERKARRKAEKRAEEMALTKPAGSHEQGNETDAVTSDAAEIDASEEVHAEPVVNFRVLGVLIAPDGARELVDDTLVDEGVSLGFRLEGYVLEVEIYGRRSLVTATF